MPRHTYKGPCCTAMTENGLCFQPVVFIADETKPSYHTYHPRDRMLSTVLNHLQPHEEMLCYYHLKKKQGLFDSPSGYKRHSMTSPYRRPWEEVIAS